MIKCWSCIAIVCLSACSSASLQQSPYDGNYYLTGDSKCEYWRQTQVGIIDCLSANKTPTEKRVALTTNQIRMYLYEKQQEAINMQYAMNQLDQISRDYQNNAQQILRSTSNFTVPQVAPISPTNTKNCYVLGRVIRCQ